MAKWIPIEQLPTGVKQIVGWCNHDADPYYLYADKCADHTWNPLEDDGDALRLRNVIGASIVDNGIYIHVNVPSSVTPIEMREYYHSEFGSHQENVDKAVRRAITRAAAEYQRLKTNG